MPLSRDEQAHSVTPRAMCFQVSPAVARQCSASGLRSAEESLLLVESHVSALRSLPDSWYKRDGSFTPPMQHESQLQQSQHPQHSLQSQHPRPFQPQHQFQLPQRSQTSQEAQEQDVNLTPRQRHQHRQVHQPQSDISWALPAPGHLSAKQSWQSYQPQELSKVSVLGSFPPAVKPLANSCPGTARTASPVSRAVACARSSAPPSTVPQVSEVPAPEPLRSSLGRPFTWSNRGCSSSPIRRNNPIARMQSPPSRQISSLIATPAEPLNVHHSEVCQSLNDNTPQESPPVSLRSIWNTHSQWESSSTSQNKQDGTPTTVTPELSARSGAAMREAEAEDRSDPSEAADELPQAIALPFAQYGTRQFEREDNGLATSMHEETLPDDSTLSSVQATSPARSRLVGQQGRPGTRFVPPQHRQQQRRPSGPSGASEAFLPLSMPPTMPHRARHTEDRPSQFSTDSAAAALASQNSAQSRPGSMRAPGRRAELITRLCARAERGQHEASLSPPALRTGPAQWGPRSGSSTRGQRLRDSSPSASSRMATRQRSPQRPSSGARLHKDDSRPQFSPPPRISAARPQREASFTPPAFNNPFRSGSIPSGRQKDSQRGSRTDLH